MIIDGIKRAALSHPAASLGGAALVSGVALVGGAPALLGSALVGAAMAATASVMDSMRNGVFQDRVSFLERTALAAGVAPQDISVTVDVGNNGTRQSKMTLASLADAKDLMVTGRGPWFSKNERLRVSEPEALRVIEAIEDRAQEQMKEIGDNPLKIASAGRYVGRIATVKDGIAVQRVNPTSFIGHEVDKLSSLPKPGALLDIQYQRETGRGTVTDMNARATEMEQPRGR